MIVDVHTHFWKDEHLDSSIINRAEQAGGIDPQFHMTSEEHLAATAVVDKAVVFGLRGTGFDIPNDAVKAQVNRAPDRLIFFTSVNPAEDGFMDELERTHRDLGARGIKLGPIYQGVHPLDDRFRLIYRYAERHGLPIVIHMATTFVNAHPLEFARPVHMDTVARDYPDLRLVLAHLGHPWIGETVSVIRRHPNVYADLSALYYRPWQFYQGLQLLFEYGTWKKALFGSDFPFTTPAKSIAGLKNCNDVIGSSGLPRIPDRVIEDILYQDTLALLGIETA